ncbi:hypothetical protein [Empedobacter tilapiae]|uniref:Response regulator n=1 Tax=Empedobacter tilapiae TaxID=2491114 RepID=A0A4Z1BQG7_9FLAO|nr:hypothetical protein [Empedobacter tilapiae]TGN24375.1 hypothetical protein E4J94_14135 [Empedobacter tilapiae]
MDVRYKIGYIDEDVNQVKLYRRKLKTFGFDVIGYEITKGMLLQDLMEQVYSSDIDLLMIDFRLKEGNILAFNGDEVEREIYDKKPQFPHIIFTNKSDQAKPDVDDPKIIFDKEIVFPSDDGDENIQTKDFIDVLTKSIMQYKNHIEKRKKTISELLEKEKTDELSTDEKNLLLSTQRDLLSLDKMRMLEVPENLTSINDLDKISKARQDAEAFINSLLENKDDESKG